MRVGPVSCIIALPDFFRMALAVIGFSNGGQAASSMTWKLVP